MYVLKQKSGDCWTSGQEVCTNKIYHKKWQKSNDAPCRGKICSNYTNQKISNCIKIIFNYIDSFGKQIYNTTKIDGQNKKTTVQKVVKEENISRVK